ncbi:hypothetical protein [Falsiroseomonas sp.]|uniref:hypothetical protein n=1 Tax=Falsiroseomonas sp. TaxID=2870721 RepID=UPI00356553CF
MAEAIRRGVVGFDAVKQLVVERIEGQPPRLDPQAYSSLPNATVRATSAAEPPQVLLARHLKQLTLPAIATGPTLSVAVHTGRAGCRQASCAQKSTERAQLQPQRRPPTA